MRFYYGLRLGRGFRIRPYAGVSLGSWSPGKRKPARQATHVQRTITIVHCSNCGALSKLGARFCNRCGAMFTRQIMEQ